MVTQEKQGVKLPGVAVGVAAVAGYIEGVLRAESVPEAQSALEETTRRMEQEKDLGWVRPVVISGGGRWAPAKLLRVDFGFHNGGLGVGVDRVGADAAELPLACGP